MMLQLCLTALMAFVPAPGEGYEVHAERRDGEWWCSVHAERANARDVVRSLALQLGVHVEGLDALAEDAELTALLEHRELRDVLSRVLGTFGCQGELRTNVLRVVAPALETAAANDLYDRAVATYLSAQRKWPDHLGAAAAKRAQAEIESQRGNVAAALAHYEALIQRHRDSSELPIALMQAAELLANEHEWESVVQRLTELLRLDRRHPYEIRARLLLARAYAMLGDHEHAFFTLDVIDTYEPAAEPVVIQRRQIIRARAELASGEPAAATATLDYVERLGRREEFALELLELRARAVEVSGSSADAANAWLRYASAATGRERADAFTRAARLALEAGDALGAMLASRMADAGDSDGTSLELRSRAAAELGIEEFLHPTDENDERLARAERLLAADLPVDALGVLKPIFDAKSELEDSRVVQVARLYAEALAETKGVDAAIDALRSTVPELQAADARRAIYVLAGELYEAHDRLDDAVEAYQGRL